MEDMAANLRRQLRHNREQLCQYVIDCAVELGTKTPTYAMLVGAAAAIGLATHASACQPVCVPEPSFPSSAVLRLEPWRVCGYPQKKWPRWRQYSRRVR